MATERKVTIATWNVPALEKAVKSLARAAKRAGVEPPPSLTVHQATRREVKQQHEQIIMDGGSLEAVHHRFYVVPVVDCTVYLPDSGKVGVPGSWSVIAVLQRVEVDSDKSASPAQLTNEIYAQPADLPRAEIYRHAPLCCEHCKADRNRTRTLVLEDVSNGTIKQVAVDCAQLYVGDRAETAIRELEFQNYVSSVIDPFAEVDPERGYGYFGSGGSRLTAWEAEEVMAHAIACVRENGWEPTRLKFPTQDPYEPYTYRPNPNATAIRVREVLLNSEKWAAEASALTSERQQCADKIAALEVVSQATDAVPHVIQSFRRRITALDRQLELIPKVPYVVTEGDHDAAEKLVAWLDEQNPRPDDEYLIGLKSAFAPGWLSEKRLAFGISLVRAHTRAIEKVEEDRLNANSRHVGKINERLTMTLKLERVVPYGGQFPGRIYAFRDISGNAFSWASSAGGIDADAIGQKFLVKATVKKHGDFRGTKQTELTRLVVLSRQQASTDGNTATLPAERPATPAIR